MFCSNGFNNHIVTDIIDVSGHNHWFDELNQVEKNRIFDCIDKTLKYSMQLVFCSEEIYGNVVDSMQYLFCSEEVQNGNTILCKVLFLSTKPEIKQPLNQLIEILNICPDAKAMNTFQVIRKRQFDLASTFDTIKQYFCSEIVDKKFVGKWFEVLVSTTKNEYDPSTKDVDSSFAAKYYLYPFLLRRPYCCLLQLHFHG